MGRSPCCDSNVKKGAWTPEEDQILIDYIQKYGQGCWKSLPKRAGLNRCGKSCRLRWANYLRPDIKRGNFSQDEQQIILHLHSIHGNKWSMIAANLPGRTDNEIKNFWNTHLKKKLFRMGIDPNTHRPISDLNSLSLLSQLISTTSTYNLMMSPWYNATSLEAAAGATQLAKIEIMENIYEAINSNPIQIIEQNNLPQFEELINGISTSSSSFSCMDSSSLMPTPIIRTQDSSPQQVASSSKCFHGGFNTELRVSNNNEEENTELPELVSSFVYPENDEGPNINRMTSKTSPVRIPVKPEAPSNVFEGLETFINWP